MFETLRPFARPHLCPAICVVAGVMLMIVTSPKSAEADDVLTKPLPNPGGSPTVSNWSGFYAGGHLGYAWGTSNWTATRPAAYLPAPWTCFSLLTPSTTRAASFRDAQAGYNYRLPDHFVMGVEADVSFPSLRNNAGHFYRGRIEF